MPIKKFVKAYPLSIICLLLIWYLCIFFQSPQTGLEKITFIDKYVHIAMYWGTCGLIWLEYLKSHKRKSPRKLWMYAVIGPIVMGGAIELAQGILTDGRSCEWLDFAADIIGVALGAMTGIYVLPRFVKNGQDGKHTSNRK